MDSFVQARVDSGKKVQVDKIPNETTLRAMKDAREGRTFKVKPFDDLVDSIDELMAVLNAEDSVL